MKLLEVNGVDITPFIKANGYDCRIEDLDASAERSMAGYLTRDRVARVPKITVEFLGYLKQNEITRIINLFTPAGFNVNFFNPENGIIQTTMVYAKIEQPKIKSTRKGYPEYDSFKITLTGYGGI
ncbi:DUF6711 family protein [Helcococcus bovis]|uniref:DUF6711 family protein n=1 Tax=Helcococcus bovis TaxID=3153252 RepID=UPI0038B957A3